MVDMGLRNRFMIVNVWRNILASPVEAWPLAMCDARTMTPEDLCVFEIHYEDRVGENYFAAASERHQWSYFPKMTREEALVFTTWDSAGSAYNPAVEGGALCMHTAFADPSMSQSAPDRQSIEVRCMCIFDTPPGPAPRPGVRALSPHPASSQPQ